MTDADDVEDPQGHVTVDEHAGGVADKQSGKRGMGHILVAGLVVVVVPMVVIGLIIGEFAAFALFMGLLLGTVGAKLNGTRRMAYVAPALGVAAGLGAFTAYDWWWVALLTTVSVIAGAGIGFGWFPALLMLPYAATFATPEASGRNAVTFGVIAAIGTGYGIVLAHRFGAATVVEGDRLPPLGAVGVAVVFGAVMGGSAALGVALGWTEPYWVPEPVLILVLYIIMGKRDRIRGKAIGTALGAAAAVPVAIASPPAWVLALVAAVAFVVALTQAKTYWLMYGLYTFSLILALSAPGQVGFEAEQRGFQILAGVGILVVGLVVLHALGRWLVKHHPQPELAPEGTLARA